MRLGPFAMMTTAIRARQHRVMTEMVGIRRTRPPTGDSAKSLWLMQNSSLHQWPGARLCVPGAVAMPA
jgi:hypothetical protein